MTSKLLTRGAIGIALAVVVNVCAAQSTVGALLDAGAKQLNKAELAVLLPGTILRNRNEQNARITTIVKADGTLTGSGISSTAHEFIFKGDWKLIESNQVCFDLLTQYGTGKHCEAMYKMGVKYFFASDPSGVITREHKVFERGISKP